MKKITLRINDNLLEMIEELKETEGYTQTTQVILDAVRFKHRTFFQTRIKKTATVDVELNKKNKEQKRTMVYRCFIYRLKKLGKFGIHKF